MSETWPRCRASAMGHWRVLGTRRRLGMPLAFSSARGAALPWRGPGAGTGSWAGTLGVRGWWPATTPAPVTPPGDGGLSIMAGDVVPDPRVCRPVCCWKPFQSGSQRVGVKRWVPLPGLLSPMPVPPSVLWQVRPPRPVLRGPVQLGEWGRSGAEHPCFPSSPSRMLDSTRSPWLPGTAPHHYALCAVTSPCAGVSQHPSLSPQSPIRHLPRHGFGSLPASAPAVCRGAGPCALGL